ncbi:MAG: hypothetical protein M3O88_02125 [Actinomycetota bacterium]|nr:hypothetical protein [Actinomycetota bacterium]
MELLEGGPPEGDEPELDNTPFDDERWGAKFTVMKENIEHHIEEEEGEMFKLARQALEKGSSRSWGSAWRRGRSSSRPPAELTTEKAVTRPSNPR